MYKEEKKTRLSFLPSYFFSFFFCYHYNIINESFIEDLKVLFLRYLLFLLSLYNINESFVEELNVLVFHYPLRREYR